ncbi:MAG: hypothetical protein KGY54_11175 [Oleiphilaceae bacterium]|nr:hypothetical protein [Oleiphilaceae bacterium]
MEQLSFNQNSAYVPIERGLDESLLDDRVLAGARLNPADLRKPLDHTQGSSEEKPGATPGEDKNTGNVTEIILPAGQVENFQLLLPMLTQLNQERRWLAWIDPPPALVNKWQTVRGIVTGEILVLRSSGEYSALSLAQKALDAGTCHAVVMWTGKLGRGALQSLQKASAAGNSHGVVLRQR